jgi:hypothetical protein
MTGDADIDWRPIERGDAAARAATHSTAAAALYAARGYRPARWFHAMKRDLKAPLADAPEPPDVQVVPFSPELSEDARLIRNEAFADHRGSTETPAGPPAAGASPRPCSAGRWPRAGRPASVPGPWSWTPTRRPARWACTSGPASP